MPNLMSRKGRELDPEYPQAAAPRMEDLWQHQFSELSGQEHTAPGMFIANHVDAQQPAMPIAPPAAPVRGAGGSYRAPSAER